MFKTCKGGGTTTIARNGVGRWDVKLQTKEMVAAPVLNNLNEAISLSAADSISLSFSFVLDLSVVLRG